MRRILVLLLAMVIAPPSLPAQEDPRVVAGSRVRVWAVRPPLSGLEGVVVAISPESLAVRPNRAIASTGASRRRLGTPVVRMPMSTIVRMDVRTAQRSRGRGALRGAGRGALVGLGAGLVAAGLLYRAAEGEGLSGFVSIMLPGVGLGAGATVGAAVGAASPGGTWERVTLPATGAAPRGPAAFRVGRSLGL